MNAIQFIQQHGIKKAREVVEGAPKIGSYWQEYGIDKNEYYGYDDFYGDWYKYWDTNAPMWQKIFTKEEFSFNRVEVKDLKRLIESVDLIGKYHSIDHAKNHYNNLRKAINQYENKDIGYLANELEQAITDYEAIYCVESIIEKREFDFGLAHDDEYVKTGDSNE